MWSSLHRVGKMSLLLCLGNFVWIGVDVVGGFERMIEGVGFYRSRGGERESEVVAW